MAHTFTGICLITEDVPGLAAFYVELLGIRATGDDTHVELVLEGASLTIFSAQGMEEMAPGSMRHAGRGAMTIGFQVEDVDAEWRRLQQLGVRPVKPPESYPWGTRSAWFRDPDGNIINLWAPDPGQAARE